LPSLCRSRDHHDLHSFPTRRSSDLSSEVHVPGPSSLPWEENDVPHGVVHHHFYHSKVVGDDRDFYVYTPPGYDQKVPYPVLYLLDRKSTRLNSSHEWISYAVFCLKK